MNSNLEKVEAIFRVSVDGFVVFFVIKVDIAGVPRVCYFPAAAVEPLWTILMSA